GVSRVSKLISPPVSKLHPKPTHVGIWFTFMPDAWYFSVMGTCISPDLMVYRGISIVGNPVDKFTGYVPYLPNSLAVGEGGKISGKVISCPSKPIAGIKKHKVNIIFFMSS